VPIFEVEYSSQLSFKTRKITGQSRYLFFEFDCTYLRGRLSIIVFIKSLHPIYKAAGTSIFLGEKGIKLDLKMASKVNLKESIFEAKICKF